MGQVRKRRSSDSLFAVSCYCLAYSQTSVHTQAVFRGFTHQQNFCTALFQREPFLIQSMTVGAPPVLERSDQLESCSMEMESSDLSRGPQFCAEKLLWWGLLSSMRPQPVVLGWRKVILQHWTTLQCPASPQQCAEEECLLSVFDTQYCYSHLKLVLVCSVL